MKNIIVSILVLLSVQSHAAKWNKVEVSDSAFALLEGIDLYMSVYELESKKSSENFMNSLKQLTYIVRNEWGIYSMPESVGVYPGDLDFSALSMDDTRTEPAPLSDETIGALTEFSLMPHFDVEIFEGSDGNTFGDCGNVYLYEKKSQQVALLSICYAE